MNENGRVHHRRRTMARRGWEGGSDGEQTGRGEEQKGGEREGRGLLGVDAVLVSYPRKGRTVSALKFRAAHDPPSRRLSA